MNIADVTTLLLIDGIDVQIDAYGTYCAESGALQSVRINRRELSVAQVDAALAILCPGDMGDWSDDLDPDVMDRLVNEAARDAADDYGDWKRDMLMEDRA